MNFTEIDAIRNQLGLHPVSGASADGGEEFDAFEMNAVIFYDNDDCEPFDGLGQVDVSEIDLSTVNQLTFTVFGHVKDQGRIDLYDFAEKRDALNLYNALSKELDNG